MDVAPSCTYPTCANSCLSQITSFVHWLVAIYSASVVDNAMVGCFLHFHEMAPRPTRNTYPVIDHRSLVSLSQSTSQNPLKAISLPPRQRVEPQTPFQIPQDAFDGHPMRRTRLRHEGCCKKDRPKSVVFFIVPIFDLWGHFKIRKTKFKKSENYV